MRFFRCFGGSSSKKEKQLLAAQTGAPAGSFQINGRSDTYTGQVAPILLESKLAEEKCIKEDGAYVKEVLKVAEVKLEVDAQETPACEKTTDGLSSDTAVHAVDREDRVLNQILLVGRDESLSLGVCESSPEKEVVAGRGAYEACGDGTEYLEDVEYDADEADGDAGHGDQGSEDSSGSAQRDVQAVLLLDPAVPVETQLYYGTVGDVGSAESGLEQADYKSEGGAGPRDKDPVEDDAHGGGHASDPEAYLQKWDGNPGELGGSCGVSGGLRSDDGSHERASELSSTMERRNGFRSSKSHAEVEDYRDSDSELPSGQACADARSVPDQSVNLSWMGSETPTDGNKLVASLALSGALGKSVSWWKSGAGTHGEGTAAGAGKLKSWGRGLSEQGDNRSKAGLLVSSGGDDAEVESNEYWVGRSSPTSDSALIPKRVAELKCLGGGDFGRAQAWLSSDSSRKDVGEGEVPSSGSAVSQFYSATPNTEDLMAAEGSFEEGTCQGVKTLKASDLVGRQKGSTPWVAEWMSRLEPEADSLDMVAETSICDWQSPKNEPLRRRSMSEGAAMDTMVGLGRSHPGSEGPAGPVQDGDLEVAAALVRSLEVGATVALFAGRGLKVAPSFCLFAHLKTIDLSKNSITRVPSNCLPKSLQHLNLSHNKLTAVEGLRDLSRLRTLKLNSNRITRIGHGLSGCLALRELYLSDNKISEVEGLHRLLKLLVLDISFNKITTTKALGQLAANYSSMQAINLAGNPVVANLGDDQFRRFMLGLVPHLVYLNKQPIKGAVASRDVASSAKEHAHKTHTKSGLRSAAPAVVRSAPGSHKRTSTGSAGAGTSSSRSHKHSHAHGGGHGSAAAAAQLAALEAAAQAVSQTSHRRHSSDHHRHRSHHHHSSGEAKTRSHHTIAVPSGLPPPLPPKAAAAVAAAVVSLVTPDVGEKA